MDQLASIVSDIDGHAAFDASGERRSTIAVRHHMSSYDDPLLGRDLDRAAAAKGSCFGSEVTPLAAAEPFGHARGAFTGASGAR